MRWLRINHTHLSLHNPLNIRYPTPLQWKSRADGVSTVEPIDKRDFFFFKDGLWELKRRLRGSKYWLLFEYLGFDFQNPYCSS